MTVADEIDRLCGTGKLPHCCAMATIRETLELGVFRCRFRAPGPVHDRRAGTPIMEEFAQLAGHPSAEGGLAFGPCPRNNGRVIPDRYLL